MYNYGNLQSPLLVGPEAKIKISHPVDSKAEITINAIIDTGAVFTAVPEFVIEQLQSLSPSPLSKSLPILAKGPFGNPINLSTYWLCLTLVNNNGATDYAASLKIAALPNKCYAIIGRDILNSRKVILNTYPEFWSMHKH